MSPAFLIFDETGWEVFLPVGAASGWAEFPHAESRQRGFILVPGSRLLSPAFVVDADHCVYAQFIRAVEQVSSDGLDLRLTLCTQSDAIPLAVHSLGNAVRRNVPHVMRLDLRPYEGLRVRLELACGPGPAGDSTADWAGIVCMAIATSDKLSLAAARSQYGWRMNNESGHFTATYRHRIYENKGALPEGESDAKIQHCVTQGARPASQPIDASEYLGRVKALEPLRGEAPYDYASRLLAALIPDPHIDFSGRLANLRPAGEKIRFLSLCAGAGRIEEAMLRTAGITAELTLVDVNETLLQQAAARMPSAVTVECMRGSVENLRAITKPPYDVVCFVSGLHHVVELEEVLNEVRSVISDHGELWLIGEQLGRNGNRLWPDARRTAERVFASLPSRLRFNHNTSRVDEHLPDLDFGSSGFEGVRSEDILPALSRFFMPVRETVRNCFLWRLTDLAYIANYNLGRAQDVAVIQMLVAEEYAFYANGGIGCELNGIYRDKLSA